MTRVMLLFVSAIVLSVPLYAQTKSADYAVKVHVSASHIGTDCGVTKGDSSCKSVQQITVLVDGAKYELQSETFFPKGIVALGDYQAKLVDDQQKPTREFTRTYDLRFADGSTRKFHVIGQTE
jgi:hypothetical protein